VLVLVIEAQGAVRSAEVETGEEPFSSVARAAALTWRFVPATRDDVPIVAKIRYQVGFTEVIEETRAAEPASGEGPEKRGAGAVARPEPTYTVDEDGVIEVDVRELLLPPNVSSLRRAEVRELPGAFGDPFRAIEILPGVTPIVSGLPLFYGRGAPPGNVGYFLDGVRVPYVFHAAAGPSVLRPALVDRVDLYLALRLRGRREGEGRARLRPRGVSRGVQAPRALRRHRARRGCQTGRPRGDDRRGAGSVRR
jgi:hypothetical protein